MKQIPISDNGKSVEDRPRTNEAINGNRHETVPSVSEQEEHGKEDNHGSQKYAKGWIALVGVIVVLYAFYIIFNLYRTTVTDYDKYARAAADEQWTLMTYTAKRGMIYDANMLPLASNTYDYTIICSPKQVKAPEMSRDEIIRSAVEILGVTYEKMDSIIPLDPNDDSDKRNSVAGCDVIKNIPKETKEKFEAYCKENKIKGFGSVAVPQRYYNYGGLASQVIGYAKNDGVSLNGLYGLEAYYNETLSGRDGYRYSETDEITGGVLPYSDATTIDATNGNNIVTNIDVNIQRIAEEAAKEAYEKYDPMDGVCAIVMNPYTGAVLAMVSLPNYDCNDPYAMPYGMDQETWDLMDSGDQVQYVMANAWRNRCVSDTYEPGSTFKALTTCMAFEENLTNEDEMFSDSPIQISSQHTISCWQNKSFGYDHGTESLRVAFQNSCNPVFTRIAERIGITKYYSYVRMLGFYDYTGIDLPAEGKGIFHAEPTKVDMDVLAYGESSTVTPIQLIMSYCAIINGGDLLVPHVVKSITDADGNIVDEIEPEVVRTVFSDSTCKRVRTLMEQVVNDGTGKAGSVPGYAVAGKTSTSTVDVGELKGKHVLSFSCYAPSYDPKIAVLVVINKPADNSVGSSSAASTAAKIVEGTLTYMGVERVFSEDDYNKLVESYYVRNVYGRTAAIAETEIAKYGPSTLFGTMDMTSDTVVSWTNPDEHSKLYKTGIVVLYPDGVTKDQQLTTRVPNLSGMSAAECIEACLKMNLNCIFVDSDNHMIDMEGGRSQHGSFSDLKGICVYQSEDIGATKNAGDIIYVRLSTTEKPTYDETEETEETKSTEAESGSEDGVADLPPDNRDEDED